MNTVRVVLEVTLASGGRRGWWKRVTGVDRTKKHGYSLQGEFLREGEHDLPLGSIVVEQYPTGTLNRALTRGTLYRVEAGGLVELASCTDWFRAFLSFQDAIIASLQPASDNGQAPLTTKED